MVYNQSQENKAVNIGLSKVPRPFIEGLKLKADIRLNGLTLNTIETASVFNPETGLTKSVDLVWVCTDIDGWWNASNVEIPDIPRGLDDGSYDVRGRWTAKIITLKGSVLVPDAYVSQHARRRLLDAINLVYTGAWLFVDEYPNKTAMYVRLSGQPLISNVSPRGRIDFEVQLKAGDPLKYSWTGPETPGPGYTAGYGGDSVTGAGTYFNNFGNSPVSTLITLTGPITAPAYITSENGGPVQRIKIIKDLRSTTFATTGVTGKQLQSGVAKLTIPSHGFFVGDSVTVTLAGTDYNISNATITEITSDSISYVKSLVNVNFISHTTNVATVTTYGAHGLTVGAVVYISGSSNPLLDGQYTLSTVPTTTTFTAAKVLGNQPTGYGGTISKQIASASGSGTVTLASTDTLVIDTYNNSTTYRGVPDESRSMLDATVDWIKFTPGGNTVTFNKTGGTGTMSLEYRSGWIG